MNHHLQGAVVRCRKIGSALSNRGLLYFAPRRLNPAIPLVFQARPPRGATRAEILHRQSEAEVNAEALAMARLIYIGVGGVSSQSALTAAQMGVGLLDLIDSDVVDQTNVARGALAKPDIGELKCLAVGRSIARSTASGSTVRAWRGSFADVLPHLPNPGRVSAILATVDNDGARIDAARVAAQWSCPVIVAGLDALNCTSGYVLLWDPERHEKLGCIQCFVSSQPPAGEPHNEEDTCAASRADMVALLSARVSWFAVQVALGNSPLYRLERIFHSGRIERLKRIERTVGCALCDADAAPTQSPPPQEPGSNTGGDGPLDADAFGVL